MNKEQAKQLSDAALTQLHQHGLTPTPRNYHVWFEHARGEIQELTQAADLLLAQDQADDAHSYQLWEQFLAGQEEKRLSESRDQLSKLLLVVAKHLKNWDSDSSAFGELLEQQSLRLSEDPDPEDFSQMLAEMTQAAEQIRHSNLEIKSSLNRLMEEVSNLRRDVSIMNSAALTDSLTGVANRRGFDQSLKESSKRAQELSRTFGLLLIDIDHFKQFNDTYGHLIGDRVLKFVATAISKAVRGSDIVSRFGGEEFAVILPHTSYAGAISVAENIREQIAHRRLTRNSGRQSLGAITVSVGATTFRFGESPEHLINRADRCLYQAKNTGRNCVVGDRQLNE